MTSSISELMQSVSDITGFTVLELLSRRKEQRLAHARQALYYLACVNTSMSFPEIGRRLNKDHTTILHGFNRAKDRLNDPAFRFLISSVVEYHNRRSTNVRHTPSPISIGRLAVSSSIDANANHSARQ